MSVVDSAFNIFSLSLAFALIGLNVYLTTSVMNITDLTCDGSVALGGCAYGALIVFGINPVVAFIFAMLLGAMAGFMTSAITIYIDVEPVLASIITLSAIQTFVIKLSSSGNMYMSSAEATLTKLSAIDNAILISITVFCISYIFYRIMNSEYGLSMKVFCCGKVVSESLGISSNKMRLVGLGIGNCLSAAAGALIVQIVGSFSVSMGTGSLVFGIAISLIGENLMSHKTVKSAIIGCFFGSIIYKLMIELLTFSNKESIGSEYSNVISAVVLIFLMASISDRKKRGRLENF
jgi:putative ABC transport system permease protein